jgi:hypothetical protein
MKRRQFLPFLIGGSTAVTVLGILNRSAHATILNDWLDGAVGSPSAPAAPAAPVYSGGASMFAEIYGEHYISREQYARLQSGSATHWYDVAPKPYARIRSDDGLEHYYFPFDFGAGGVTIVSDTTGAIASWDIATEDWVPEFSPVDMSEYNYYPPKAKEAAAAAPTGCP